MSDSNTLTTERLQELLKVAEGEVSPGIWRVLEVMGKKFLATQAYEGHPYHGHSRNADVLGDEDYPRKDADLEFVATFQPALCAELCRELLAKEEARDKWASCARAQQGT